MRKNRVLFFILYSLFVIPCLAQPAGQWVWLRGNKTMNSVGNFGIQGVPSVTNDPPGLYEACEWADKNGDFWLYGGSGLGGGAHDDLWKYEPRINIWTWISGTGLQADTGNYGVQGIPSPSNHPPGLALGVVSWVTLDGSFWLFGGNNGGGYSDLWKYDPLTNIWTWMKGPGIRGQLGVYGKLGVPDSANNPGNRWEAATGWTDNNGDLWLFGGSGNYNDLWRYSIATNMWTWMKGPNIQGSLGVYGTKGVEDSLNTPGCRSAYGRWKDRRGNLWLFGGFDFSNHTFGDLWRFNPTTNNWTWMNGSSTSNLQGEFGTKCFTSAAAFPGARMENRAAWTDTSGNFWMFGGYVAGNLWNDLWKYCVASNQWTWMGGDSVANAVGNWGVKGVPSPANVPSGRYGSLSWRDNPATGPFHLYLFGGHGNYNDMWRYTIDTACSYCPAAPPVPAFSADTDICVGDCINFSDQSLNGPSSYQWSFPGGLPSSSSFANPTVCYDTAGTYDAILIQTNYFGSDTLIRKIIVNSPSQAPLVIKHGDTLFLPQGYKAYQWYFQDTALTGETNYFLIAKHSGKYSVSMVNEHGCSIFIDYIDVEVSISLYPEDEGTRLRIFPNPSIGKFEVLYTCNKPLQASIAIFNNIGEKVYSELKTFASGSNTFNISTDNFPPGFYTFQINANGQVLNAKLMVKK